MIDVDQPVRHLERSMYFPMIGSSTNAVPMRIKAMPSRVNGCAMFPLQDFATLNVAAAVFSGVGGEGIDSGFDFLLRYPRGVPEHDQCI